LNQAETAELQAAAGRISGSLLPAYDAVLVGSLAAGSFQAFERTAGILLAAGASARLGRPKQLLDWHGRPFVRAIAQTALAAGLDPLIAVTGAFAPQVETALEGLPVKVVYNKEWKEGQASSIRAGLHALTGNPAGSAIFLLADQPQVSASVLKALADAHAAELAPVVAPLVLEQRANPVLFDRLTFPDLLMLQGDTGGRGIFHKHSTHYLPWHDGRLLLDVDTPEQYARLMEEEIS
jgi:molybdenum cofactor cytidylyltransferase